MLVMLVDRNETRLVLLAFKLFVFDARVRWLANLCCICRPACGGRPLFVGREGAWSGLQLKVLNMFNVTLGTCFSSPACNLAVFFQASLGNEGIDELMNVPIEMPPSPFDPFIEEGKGIRPEIHEYAARDWVELRPDKTVPEDKVIGVIPRKRDIEAKKKEEEEREKAEKENGEKRNKTLVADELSHPGD